MVVEKADGSRQEIALDESGISVQVAPAGYCEPLPVGRLTRLELQQHQVNPVLVATMGQFVTPYMVNPESVLHVGAESFTVAELADLTLETNGATR